MMLCVCKAVRLPPSRPPFLPPASARGRLAASVFCLFTPRPPAHAQAGGFVRRGRTNGSLSLSRALGDFEFKRNGRLPASGQMITAFPEVRPAKMPPFSKLPVACSARGL